MLEKKEWGMGNGEWEIENGNFCFFRLIVYNAEKIFFSGDYRYPRF